MELRAITWNLFHGRDFPPNRALRTLRSRLLRTDERDSTHLQVNRELADEFAGVLDSADWDVALLQECPPRWAEALADACRAEGHGVLTSRNSLPRLRAALARLNPDLIASNEGGSNLTLVRLAYGSISERRLLVLRRRPERRVAALTRLGDPEVCLVNLHASAGAANRHLAEQELLAAAERAVAWAGERPLLLGGDLNVRPQESVVFELLADRFGLRPPTPRALDHLLGRNLRAIEPPAAWPPSAREVREGGLAIRLSDHAPIQGRFAVEGLDRDG